MAYPRFVAARRHKFVNLSADITTGLTSTSFATLSSSLDMAVEAQVGDVLVYQFGAYVAAPSSNSLMFDVATLVSSAAVNWFSSGSATGKTDGVGPWRADSATTHPVIDGRIKYTVQAGDLVAPDVTCRLYYAVSGGTSASVFATNYLCQVSLENIGPVEPN
jgi:hypothetical protein